MCGVFRTCFAHKLHFGWIKGGKICTRAKTCKFTGVRGSTFDLYYETQNVALIRAPNPRARPRDPLIINQHAVKISLTLTRNATASTHRAGRHGRDQCVILRGMIKSGPKRLDMNLHLREFLWRPPSKGAIHFTPALMTNAAAPYGCTRFAARNNIRAAWNQLHFQLIPNIRRWSLLPKFLLLFRKNAALVYRDRAYTVETWREIQSSLSRRSLFSSLFTDSTSRWIIKVA